MLTRARGRPGFLIADCHWGAALRREVIIGNAILLVWLDRHGASKELPNAVLIARQRDLAYVPARVC